METTFLCIDIENLIKVANCFLDAFDKSLSYSEIYDEMTQFLRLIEPDLVNELFSSMLFGSKLTGVKLNRMTILQRHYETRMFLD